MTPEEFDEGAAYQVVLKRDIPAGSMVLRAGEPVQLRGKYCAKIAADIESAEKIGG